jgi:hypothetical protein
VVAFLYVPTALALAWLDPVTTVSSANLPVSLSGLYAAVLALVVGSIASAEERRLGMLDWQLLVPIRATTQWLIKVAVAFALFLALGVLMPWVVVELVGARHDLNQRAATVLLAGLFALLAGSLYVSTLCRSGITALVLSLPVVMASWLWVITVSIATWRYLHMRRFAHPWAGPDAQVTLVLAVGLVAILLTLGARNHRSVDVPWTRVLLQSLMLVLWLTVSVVIFVAARF